MEGARNSVTTTISMIPVITIEDDDSSIVEEQARGVNPLHTPNDILKSKHTCKPKEIVKVNIVWNL